MEHTLVSAVLAMLLSFSLAAPLMEQDLGEEIQTEDLDDFDFTSRILRTNKRSRQMLVEGDLVVSNTRNALKCWKNSCFWKKSENGVVEVPYIMSRDFSTDNKLKIKNAMKTFNTTTCIRFVPLSTQLDYLSIENLDGCYSTLGRAGGKQVVSLSKSGCIHNGVIQHELNHALGFYHEQTRSDRDQYVRINWQFIAPENFFDFEKQDTNNLKFPYHYGSIMHYGRTAFAKQNGKETITPIPDPSVEIGQRTGLSVIDIQRINKLYDC